MDFLFSGNDIHSFTYFWKPLLQLEGGQYLKKCLISARENRFLRFFSGSTSNGSSFWVQ